MWLCLNGHVAFSKNNKVNRLILLENMILYVGVSFETVSHQHHAGQICIGLTKPIQLIDKNDEEGTFRSVFIPANTPHQLVAHETIIATLYLDIQNADYEMLMKHKHDDADRQFVPISLSAGIISGLSAMGGEADGSVRLREIIEQMMNELIAERPAVSNLDPRIVTVIQALDSHSESQVPLGQLAASVHLSPSRLLSLFKSQIGTPIRRYSLWRRIRVAMEHAVKHESLTEGAHHAGFTDSAHFSRVFKEMYGMNPSGIVNKHFPIEILFE